LKMLKENFKDRLPTQFKTFSISPKQKFTFLLFASVVLSIKALKCIEIKKIFFNFLNNYLLKNSYLSSKIHHFSKIAKKKEFKIEK